MSFHVYENWQAGPHKAVFHRGDCGFCNNGEGLSGGRYDPDYGKWHGPFSTLDDAKVFERSLSGVVVRRQCRCIGLHDQDATKV